MPKGRLKLPEIASNRLQKYRFHTIMKSFASFVNAAVFKVVQT